MKLAVGFAITLMLATMIVALPATGQGVFNMGA
jgi:hypothetical protein